MGEEEFVMYSIKKIIVCLFICLMIHNSQKLYPQERDSVISNLAKYSIIDYTLKKYWNHDKSISSLSLSELLNELVETIRTDNYKFEGNIFYTYKNYYFVNISDQTNFQLHGNNETIFAIDTTALAYEESIFLIDPEQPEIFINENFKKYLTMNEIPSIIQLYGKLKSISNESIEIYNGENVDSFGFIDKQGYRLSDLLRFDQSTEHVSTVYKVNHANTINYYYLDFIFKNSTMEVIESLLFRLPKD